MFHASLLTPAPRSLTSLVIHKEARCSHTDNIVFCKNFLLTPIFLAGIISSDTDSKYCISLGFITLLYAIINPSEAEACPKLAVQLDLRASECLAVCVGPLCVVPREADGFFA